MIRGATPGRYVTRQVRGFRWMVWDSLTGGAHTAYVYHSKHKCNRACDRLNGISNRAAKRYQHAKDGE